MPTRSRTRLILPGPGYAARKIGSNPVNEDFPLQDEVASNKWRGTCDDTYGSPNQDHPLTITERDNRGLRPLNGFQPHAGGGHTEFRNYLPNMGLVTHASITIPSVGIRATTLRARSNPSREEVSIPNFLYELKDLPQMWRNLKNLGPLLRQLKKRDSAALSGLSSQYLGYEFGWKPLLSDLGDLLRFQKQVDRRILELQRLYSGNGLKRRLNLFDSTTETVNSVVQSSAWGVNITVKKMKITRKRSWGTIRWRPTSVPRDIGHQALGKRARRLVHGMDHLGVDAVQAWNALPFTWLADWFGNFGEFLEAHRNDVPAAPTGPCNIMTLTESYETWERTDGWTSTLKGVDGMRILRTKERAQSSGTLSAHLPFVTARQFGILSALNLQRRKR